MQRLLFIGLVLIGLCAPCCAQNSLPLTDASKSRLAKHEVLLFSNANFADRDTPAWNVTKRTLKGGSQDGVQLLVVDNGALKVTLIPTRGMSIYKVESEKVTLGWNSPVKQIVHPSHVDLNDHGGLGWLAGFNEMMVRCGVSFAGHPGEDDGKMLTLHGRIGNIPASNVVVKIDDKPPYRIRVRGKVEEKMFKFGVFELWTEVSTVPGSRSFRISDRLINKSEYEQEYQIIYHSNFGRPILGKGAKFVAPEKKISPFDEYAAKDIGNYQTYLGPTKNYGEQVYCLELNADERGHTQVMLHNAAADRGVAMKYTVDTLPFFTLWKNTDTETDGYVTGLEPGTGYPYNRSVERLEGRVPKLKPGGEVKFTIDFSVLESAEAVTAAEKEIAKIQGRRKPQIESSPPRSKAISD